MTETTNTETTVRWTFVGRRITAKQKLGAFFIDAEGQEHGFLTKDRYVIGGEYDVVVTAEGRYRLPKVLAAPVAEGDERVAGWVLEDRLAQQEEVKIARLKRDNKEGIMEAEEAFRSLTLAQLGERYAKTIGRGRKAALLAQIIEEITR